MLVLSSAASVWEALNLLAWQWTLGWHWTTGVTGRATRQWWQPQGIGRDFLLCCSDRISYLDLVIAFFFGPQILVYRREWGGPVWAHLFLKILRAFRRQRLFETSNKGIHWAFKGLRFIGYLVLLMGYLQCFRSEWASLSLETNFGFRPWRRVLFQLWEIYPERL